MKLLFLQNMFDKVYNLVTVFINKLKYSTVRNYSIANMPKPIIQLNMIIKVLRVIVLQNINNP